MATKTAKKKAPAKKSASAKKSAPVKKKPAIQTKMTKTAILAEIAENAELSKQQVSSVLDELENLIERHLRKRGVGEFTLPGLMKIRSVKRPATKKRMGRNPATGEEIVIGPKPASTRVRVTALKRLKEMVLIPTGSQGRPHDAAFFYDLNSLIFKRSRSRRGQKMRQSQLLLPTLKENPADADAASHRLMLRAGLIRQVAAGIYTWLPLGLRVLRKIERILREELDASGAQELLMPVVQPAELWEETGRWGKMGPELARLKDRNERDFCLGPTHEEIITDVFRREIHSYKQLPCNFYQIQTKFRDEIRPRFGVMRAREFTMKDGYSFDTDQASFDRTYQRCPTAIPGSSLACGCDFRAVEADSGNIGGSQFPRVSGPRSNPAKTPSSMPPMATTRRIWKRRWVHPRLCVLRPVNRCPRSTHPNAPQSPPWVGCSICLRLAVSKR